MMKRADLNPSLGMWDRPGPCLVVERIENQVRHPDLRQDLSEKVEHGQKLTNPEASKVYSVETERGGGIFQRMEITAHAQYRMDQRGITVSDIRMALQNYSKKLNDWKSQGSFRWSEFQRGGVIEWVDKKLGDLQVIFKPKRSTAVIISVYWKGQQDPRPQSCGDHPKHARSVEDLSGFRTFVQNPTPSKSDTGDGKYPTQGLPSPWSRSKPTNGPTVLNMPGESGSDSSGNIHEDKARTKGVPGGQYDGGATHPDTPASNTLVRRPGMTAGGVPNQLFHLTTIKALRKILRTNKLHLGGFSIRVASKATGAKPCRPQVTAIRGGSGYGGSRTGLQLRQRPEKRRRKQRGGDKLKAKQRYRKNRMHSKMQSRKRYKHLKRNPQFKKQQQIRRKHPERFKMRRGEVLTAPEIAFALDGGAGNLVFGYLRNISGLTGLVHFYLDEPGRRMLRSMPVRDFLIKAAFLSPEDLDAAYLLIDAEVGVEAYGEAFSEYTDLNSDLVNLYVIESDFMHADDDERNCEYDDELVDPQDDDFYYGAVNKLANDVIGTFFREIQPPPMDPNTVYDRANDHDDRERVDRKPGDKVFSPYDKEVQDSNPGSRVYPGGKDHLEKRSAALIQEIREGCASDLVARSEGLQFKLSRADQRNAVWLFDVQGSKQTYRVRLKAIRKGNIRDIQKVQVKVSCSCPFWQWQGPEFYAKQGGYLYGKPRGLATKPDVRDPNGQHLACKHVLAILRHVTSNQWSVPKGHRMAYALSDALRFGSVVAEFPQFESSSRRVAARYLASLEVSGA